MPPVVVMAIGTALSIAFNVAVALAWLATMVALVAVSLRQMEAMEL